MTTFDIRLTELLFDRNRSPIGQIWIETDGLAFPHAHWSDFALVVMSWFGSALLNAINGGENGVFDFMEGPYSLEIQAAPGGILEISGKSGSARDYEIFRRQISASCIIRTFISKAEYLLGLCKENSWWSNDVIALKATTCALTEYMRARGEVSESRGQSRLS